MVSDREIGYNVVLSIFNYISNILADWCNTENSCNNSLNLNFKLSFPIRIQVIISYFKHKNHKRVLL